MFNPAEEYGKISTFESYLCKYTGSPYAVSVDCCTNALKLCFDYSKPPYIILPKNTFIGVANSAHQLGIKIYFEDIKWSGLYKISPLDLYDSARRFTSNMYIKNSLMCLSFHYKKTLKIGRGGAILTDNKEIYDWLVLARNNTKDVSKHLSENVYNFAGYNMLLHPDLALKGTELLKQLPLDIPDLPDEHYGDLSRQIKYLPYLE